MRNFNTSRIAFILRARETQEKLIEASVQSNTEYLFFNRSTLAFRQLGETVQFTVATCKRDDSYDARIGALWAFEQLNNGYHTTMATEDFETAFGQFTSYKSEII